MAIKQLSGKRLAISKSNAQMVAVVAIASILTVFCLVASKTVFSQNSYQSRVIKGKETAHQQLQTNIANYGALAKSYNKFDSAQTNIIGGSKDGTGNNDGPNSQIILDALPDKYDFPALTSSIEKILAGSGLKVTSITGTDDQLAQQNNKSSTSPQPVQMPFAFSISNASYASVGQLISTLQASIRPIQIDTLDISGSVDNMTVTVNAHTWFQPAKTVSITKQEVQ